MTITIPGIPIPWARARQRGRRFFTDPVVAAHKRKIRLAAKDLILAPAGERVHLECVFIFERPKSNKTMHHTQKPDLDNLVKLVCDALNGIAWHDDVQVATIVASKLWGEHAKTQIEVTW